MISSASRVCLAMLLIASVSNAQSRSYRYALTDNFGDTKFNGEIRGVVDPGSRHYEIYYDASGRITRYALIRNGKPISQVIFSYTGNATKPSGYENVTATGEISASVKLQRNDLGERIRGDQYSTLGKLTRYYIRVSSGDSAVVNLFTADGIRLRRSVYWFSAGGSVVRERDYPNDSTSYESDLTEDTGLERESRKYEGAKLVVKTRSTYDTDGSLTRTDIYTAEGVWYGSKEYADDLLTVASYKFPDGSSEATYTVYDANRRALKADFKHNGITVCTFKYEMLPTGVVNRTLAIAPDGSLMAEYPNIIVASISQNGEALDHPGVAIIHKKGNWW